MPGMCLLPFWQSLMPSQGGQSHGMWHSSTLLLARLLFLSWHCSGHPGRELGTDPASCHSFTTHHNSIIISSLTLAGSSCPKPSTINGAQYISPLSLQPSLCMHTCLTSWTWLWCMQGYCQVSSVFGHEQSAQTEFTPWLKTATPLLFPSLRL